MIQKTKRAARAACVAWCIAMAMLSQVSAADAALPPVEAFLRAPDIQDVVLSPSGKRLAMTMAGAKGLLYLAVLDLDPIGKPRVVAAYGDGNVERVLWVNDERLAYEVWQRQGLVDNGGVGVFAVNHDGTQTRRLSAWRNTFLVAPSRASSKELPYGWSLVGAAHQGDDVYFSNEQRDGVGDVTNVVIARVNTTTGNLRNLSSGMPAGTRSWVLDRERVPRIAVVSKKGRTSIRWRNPTADQWEEVAEFDPLGPEAFTPLRIDDAGKLLVEANLKSEFTGIYRFDPSARRIEPEPVLQVKGFDLSPAFESDPQTERVLGVHFTADRPASYWFDPAMERIQRGVDAALPGRFNQLFCGNCETSPFLVVRSQSDRQPGEYYLFDRAKTSLARIGAARARIDEATQGRRTFHRVTARDGLSMPLYVTRPAGIAEGEPRPAVLLVHGGPWVRGSDLHWSAWPQFFASRGYVVLEPEFRGSTGYGGRLFQAGWKQWGRAMQDDLIDAIQWAAAQRLVDPKRVCVVGSSYGGYAALMGPIANPEAYRCAASYAGVTDIDLMYDISWSDFSSEWRRYGMPVLIGDQRKDAAILASVSPIRRAGEIKVPVLLGHGAGDVRVPISHFRDFRSAAKAAGVELETVVYDNESHSLIDPANEADYLRRLERLLAKSLAPAP
jgi:dienelactone hydrolase